jgi:hypothetical protein
LFAPLVLLNGCAGLVSVNGSNTTPSTLSITSVQAVPATTSTSQIAWTTNVPADSSVDYGTTAAFGSSTPVNSAMVTSHQVTLTGLAAGTTYYYQVSSSDSRGNHGHSGGHSFTTPGFSISGTISPASNGSGATLTLGGATSAKTTADGSGNFSFTGLANGTYTVTPSRTGYTFTPTSQTAGVNGVNVTGESFSATASAVAPTITTQPASQAVVAGQTATFRVVASGAAPSRPGIICLVGPPPCPKPSEPVNLGSDLRSVQWTAAPSRQSMRSRAGTG